MLDGLEITQFTYFQQSGGVDLEPISVELTYGLERIAAFLQNVEDVYQVHWNETVTYGDMRRPEELELSVYDFEAADPETCRKLLDLYEGEASRLLGEYPQDLGARGSEESKIENRKSKVAPSLEFRGSSFVHPEEQQSRAEHTSSDTLAKDRFPLRKVYDLALKCSHLFNILDARGAISVTERVALIARVRKLACEVAAIYLQRQASAEVRA
jgi:glycyl-tRNA synthetase alpha chain